VSSTQIGANEDLALENVLRQIESEPPEGVRARERNTFDEIAGPFGERLVLFGAGPLGKGVLAGLRQAGVEPLSFADNNQELWGKDVSGLLVLSPDDAVRAYGETACFVVTIYQGSRVRRQLASLGCRRVSPFVPLLWKYADIFIPQSGIELPHRLVKQCEAVRACHAMLADDKSRCELREQLVWRYWLDYSALSPPLDAQDTYFPMDLLSPSDDDVFVDCGAFDGDTIRSFNDHWDSAFRHAFAFEPDPENRTALSSSVVAKGLGPRVTIMPYAVGNTNGPVSFTCTSSAASHVTTGESGAATECRRLDDIEWSFTPTYVKMDIESAEPEALAGAAELLRQHHPVLAVCTYHRSEHLWQIPNLIRSIAPEYHLFLRRYAEECWEGVCYAIPSHRLKRA
jgi:FkbM family methyltransferase